MNSEQDNYTQLANFFGEEYQAIKAYVNSRISGVDNDAEDILQEVALKLFTSVDRYSPINNVAGFVYRSVKNKIIDIMRRNSQQGTTEELYETRLAHFTELFMVEESAYSEELKTKLKEEITCLKPLYRDVILAIDFEGYSYRQLEQQSGIPQGTWMSRRHRAIAMLHNKLIKLES